MENVVAVLTTKVIPVLVAIDLISIITYYIASYGSYLMIRKKGKLQENKKDKEQREI